MPDRLAKSDRARCLAQGGWQLTHGSGGAVGSTEIRRGTVLLLDDGKPLSKRISTVDVQMMLLEKSLLVIFALLLVATPGKSNSGGVSS